MECFVRQGLVSDIQDLPATDNLLHIVDQLLIKRTDAGMSCSLFIAHAEWLEGISIVFSGRHAHTSILLQKISTDYSPF